MVRIDGISSWEKLDVEVIQGTAVLSAFGKGKHSSIGQIHRKQQQHPGILTTTKNNVKGTVSRD